MNTMTTALRTGRTPATPRNATTEVSSSRIGLPALWVRRVSRGPQDDPRWARPALVALLALTAALYFWNLTASGWANSFYSAAAQAGAQSWEAFLFGSSDAANSITVDKPPASLWVMDLSVRAFGLNSFAILMPQVLMGVTTVGLVYACVKRYFTAAGGLLAGVVMALTPVAVLMFRFNNPDALLVLLLTAAAYATLRAVENGSIRWMSGAGALIGLAFLTKTLQAFLVVPTFGLVFLFLAAAPVRRRLIGCLAAVGSLLVVGGWWVALVELMPASMRPYIGGSQTNSFLELTFGYNGFGRLSGSEIGSVGGGGGGAGTGAWGETGLTRLFDAEIGGQISWLIPSAMILLAVGLVFHGRSPRGDLRRAAYLVWGGWLITTMLTFSFMAGIFHAYYTVALAPAIAALVGMGGAEAWQRRGSSVGRITMAAATAAAATWSFILLSRTTAYGDWLRIGVLAIGMAAALLILAMPWLHRRFVLGVMCAALVAGLAGPAAYSFSTLTSAHQGSIVVAGPNAAGPSAAGPSAGGHGGRMPTGAPGTSPAGFGDAARTAAGGSPGAPDGATSGGGIGGLLNSTAPSTQVVSTLSAGASKYTWVAAAVGSQQAAGLQLGTQLPVMAIGGFNGSDPSPTLAQFQALVREGKIHYLLAGDVTSGQSGSQNTDAARIMSWAMKNFRPVTIGTQTFYDLTQST